MFLKRRNKPRLTLRPGRYGRMFLHFGGVKIGAYDPDNYTVSFKQKNDGRVVEATVPEFIEELEMLVGQRVIEPAMDRN